MADRFKVTLAVIFLVVVSVITVTANDESTKIVVVNYLDEVTQYETDANTYAEFLKDEGFSLNTIITDKDINDGLTLENEITISYEIPITLKTDDETTIVFFPEGITIREILESTKTDTIEYVYELEEIDFPIYEPYTINVNYIKRKFFTQEVEVPFDTEYVEDSSMLVGEEIVIQEGVLGQGLLNNEVVYYNKEEVQRNELETEVVVEPINEIIQIGTKNANVIDVDNVTIPPALQGYDIDVETLVYKEKITMNASAYTAGYESTGKRPGDYGYGITASGAVAQRGTVAVDPNVIPLGTTLYVEGYGLAIAADTGGAIRGHKIDLFYENLSDALQFGRRNIDVYILEN